MSETKLTRWTFGVIALNMPDPAMKFCKASDADALLAERDAEIARLRKLQPWADDVPLNKDLKPTGHVEWLIQYLLTVHKRFGNTAVVVEGLRWGASDLWARDELVSQLAAHREAVRKTIDQLEYMDGYMREHGPFYRNADGEVASRLEELRAAFGGNT